MKHIILCADDYGQNQSISQAIIDLIAKKRLSATSCMTNSKYWAECAQQLLPFGNKVDIGLHINFTDGKPLAKGFIAAYGEKMFSLGQLLVRAYLRQLNPQAMRDEIHAQLDSFESAMKRLPDFIDGHQHVHQFPVIRDAVLEVYEQRLRANGTYIRSVNDNDLLFRLRAPVYAKRAIIQLTGASELKRQLVARQIPHNSSFSGIYQFANAKNYGDYFPGFLDSVKNNGLIMCHPGFVDTTEFDAISDSRSHEYRYFASEQFLRDCDAKQVIINQFNR